MFPERRKLRCPKHHSRLRMGRTSPRTFC
uniref:Uncharacterized protein n=1 Tax=Anguilla anguilla TaxID=7936 RepID=A0A0E9SVR8_ANGAN